MSATPRTSRLNPNQVMKAKLEVLTELCLARRKWLNTAPGKAARGPQIQQSELETAAREYVSACEAWQRNRA